MRAPSVLYLVTEPWYFANHRLDHARALMMDGFEVHVATRAGDRWDELAKAGCRMHDVDLARGVGGLRGLIREVREVRSLVRGLRPTIVHAVALKPLAIALFLIPMHRRPTLILGVNGLGLSAADGGRRLTLIRYVIRSAAKVPRVVLLFQTRADQSAIVGDANRGVVIPGVGVDTERFRPGVRPAAPPCVVVYLGRAVKSKGLPELVRAMNGEIGSPPSVELHLYCTVDESSPGALSAKELADISNCPGITVFGSTRTPEVVLAGAHAAILPSSAGEGVSKFVLEAMASGTPVLLAAQSGSAEVIESGVTGIVFDSIDVSIRDALEEVSGWSPEHWSEVSVACRAAAERSFALDVILPQIVNLHRRAAEGTTG